MAKPEDNKKEPVIIPARFRDHERRKGWVAARFVRIVRPQFADPYALVIETSSGNMRSRPIPSVEIEVPGPRGGRRLRPLAENLDYVEAVEETNAILNDDDAMKAIAEAESETAA